ncbi:RHS repeat protein [Pseudomonas putida]|nr:RHS repeat protein [Pseudomonas putida]
MHNVEPELHRNTPTVTVIDNRGLNIREIVYHRHPDTPLRVEERITHHQHDARGFLARSADPRLANAGRVNFSYLSDLGGGTLRTRSVDAGGSVALNDVAGRPCLAVSQIGIDAQGCDDASQAVTRTWFYEDGASGRLLGVTEQAAGESTRIMERCVWAGLAQEARDLNLAGQRIRHYDPAGMVEVESIALSGKPHTVTRRLLKGTDEWQVVADWQGAGAADWDALLDTDAYTNVNTADATGAVLTTLDAVCNLQRVSYDVAGQLNGSWLTLENGLERTIVKSLEYSATGQKLREEHGNGVVTHYTYEPATQRLASIKTERPAGRASGAKVLQDLRYAFDPVGNVLNVRNDAEATRFWRNQKVVPQSTYTYDTLYQLASASGREMANAGQQGQGGQFPPFTPIDSATFTRYTRTYTYDSAGNLIRIRHSAPASNSSYTNDITVSDCSNRAVSSTLEPDPSQVEALFTPGGQQRLLLPGQRLAWTPRAELRHVTLVARQGGMDDGESYRYDSDSQRVMKVSIQQASGSAQARRVMYLPELERRTVTTNGNITEDLHVVTVGGAGRAQVRVLHWKTGRPAELANDRLRYSYYDMLGSSTLEVDGAGNVITREEYYPFGGTAVWAARNEVEAHYKTVRYSGKERDATGLYYYGYRYYQPWIGRWLSADPAGTADGINIFRYCRNSPMGYKDDLGKNSYDVLNEHEMSRLNAGLIFVGRGLEALPEGINASIHNALGMASSWLDSLIQDLSRESPSLFANKMMEMTFGSDYSWPGNDPEGLNRAVLLLMAKLKRYVVALQGAESWRIAVVEGQVPSWQNVQGVTNYSVAQGSQITLPKNVIETSHPVVLAQVLLHEASHALFALGSDEYISDFFYSKAELPPKDASQARVEEYLVASISSNAQWVPDKNGQMTALDESSMQPNIRSQYINIFNTMLAQGGLPPAVSQEERKDMYRHDPAVRQSILLRNADSLAVLAMQFHKF